MRYLVTGGTGFIGSALVKSLVADGHHVRVFDNNSRGNHRRIHDVFDQVEFVEGNICDYNSVLTACENIDFVCHLAYVNGTEFFYSKPEVVLEVAVKGIVNILDACLAHSIKSFLQMSSSEVYQTPSKVPTDESVPLVVPDVSNPRYSYGGGKIMSELMAINYGRKYFDHMLVVRPHNVYGPDMGWEHVVPQFCLRMKDLTDRHPDSKELEFPIQGSGQETRSFVYIDDFIRGTRLAMSKGENLGIYHIGTMDEIKIEDLAYKVGQCFGNNLKIVPGELQKGGTKRRCPDVEKIKQLGYQPSVTLDAGLEQTVSWYRANFHLQGQSLS